MFGGPDGGRLFWEEVEHVPAGLKRDGLGSQSGIGANLVHDPLSKGWVEILVEKGDEIFGQELCGDRGRGRIG